MYICYMRRFFFFLCALWTPWANSSAVFSLKSVAMLQCRSLVGTLDNITNCDHSKESYMYCAVLLIQCVTIITIIIIIFVIIIIIIIIITIIIFFSK